MESFLNSFAVLAQFKDILVVGPFNLLTLWYYSAYTSNSTISVVFNYLVKHNLLVKFRNI